MNYGYDTEKACTLKHTLAKKLGFSENTVFYTSGDHNNNYNNEHRQSFDRISNNSQSNRRSFSEHSQDKEFIHIAKTKSEIVRDIIIFEIVN